MKNIIVVLSILFSSAAFAKHTTKYSAEDNAAIIGSSHLSREFIGRPIKIVSVVIVEHYKEYYLTQVTVKKSSSNEVYCIVIQIDEDLNGSVIDNYNDIMGQYIQRCSAVPTQDELNKIKFLNRWPNIGLVLNASQQQAIIDSITK